MRIKIGDDYLDYDHLVVDSLADQSLKMLYKSSRTFTDVSFVFFDITSLLFNISLCYTYIYIYTYMKIKKTMKLLLFFYQIF